MQNETTIPIVSQFTWGKLLTSSRAQSGYQVVASSPTVASDLVDQIRQISSIGQPSDLSWFSVAFGLFRLENTVVFVRYERNPSLDQGRPVLQFHYVIIDQDSYAQIKSKFWLVIPKLLPIPSRSVMETLKVDSITVLPDRSKEVSTLSRYLRPTSQFLREFLNALFTPLPILIFSGRQNGLESLDLIESASLLLPPRLRPQLTFATASFDARQIQTRIRIVTQRGVSLPAQFVSVDLESRRVELPHGLSLSQSSYVDFLFSWMQLDPKHDIGGLLGVIDNFDIVTTSAWEKLDTELLNKFWQFAGSQVLIWEIESHQGRFEVVCDYLQQHGNLLELDVADYLLRFVIARGFEAYRDALDFVPDILASRGTEHLRISLATLFADQMKEGKSRQVIDLLERWIANSVFLATPLCLQLAIDILGSILSRMGPDQLFEGLQLIRRWLQKGMIQSPSTQLPDLLRMLAKDTDYLIAEVWPSLFDLISDYETLRAFLEDPLVSKWIAQSPPVNEMLVTIAHHERLRTRMILDVFETLRLPLIPFVVSIVKMGLRLGEISLLTPWVCQQVIRCSSEIASGTNDPELGRLIRNSASPQRVSSIPRIVQQVIATIGIELGDYIPFQQLIVDAVSSDDDAALESILTVAEGLRSTKGIDVELYGKLLASSPYRSLSQDSQKKLILALINRLTVRSDHPLLPAVSKLLEAHSLETKWSRTQLEYLLQLMGKVRYEIGFTQTSALLIKLAVNAASPDEAKAIFESVRGEHLVYYGHDQAKERYGHSLQSALGSWFPNNLLYVANLVHSLQAEDFLLEAHLIQVRLVLIATDNPEVLGDYVVPRIKELSSIIDFLGSVDRELISHLRARAGDENTLEVLRRLAEKKPLGSSKLDQLQRELEVGKKGL